MANGHVGGDALLSAVNALNSTSNWITRVLQQMQVLRWQVVGFDRSPSGAHDSNRPLYSMTNPNAAFDELIAEYSQEVSESVRLLHATLGNSETQLSTSSTSANSQSSHKRSRRSSQDLGSIFANGHDSGTAYQDAADSAALKLVSGSVDSSDIPQELGDWNQLFSDLGVLESEGKSTEKKTFYIVCRPFTHNQESFGFPAYDMNKAVIGFYRESQDASNQATQIEFVALGDEGGAAVVLPRAERDRLEAQLRTLVQSGSSAVYALPDHLDDLERMKQDVLVGYWLSEVSMEDF